MQHATDMNRSIIIDRGDVPVARDHIDLMDLVPGQTVAVTTRNSSYWLTRTLEGEEKHVPNWQARYYVIGFAVQSDSQTLNQWPGSPRDYRIERFISLDHPFYVGIGHTSRVTSITLLRPGRR